MQWSVQVPFAMNLIHFDNADYIGKKWLTGNSLRLEILLCMAQK
jgi:hypothetical protein